MDPTDLLAVANGTPKVVMQGDQFSDMGAGDGVQMYNAQEQGKS